jgi:translin
VFLFEIAANKTKGVVCRYMSSSSSGIQGSLEQIDKNLKDVQDRREKLIKGTRDVVMLCSKSIVAMHHSQLEDAKSKMDQAKAMLEEFRNYAGHDLYRYIAVAEQELVEAYALKSVMDDKPMPSMRELDVTGESYLTGLLDCVGEIKRLVYDRMRMGEGKDAEKLFATMEEIYNAIYPFAVYDNIVSGLRKKLDVARKLIEDIRATVTEESRRKALIEAVGAFEKRTSKGGE